MYVSLTRHLHAAGHDHRKDLSDLLRFTIPLFPGNIFQQFYRMADTIIVGRCLGAAALAAVGAAGTVSFLLPGFAMGLATGFSVLTAQRYKLIISRGLAASMFYNLFSSFLRSVGNSRIPLFFQRFCSPAKIPRYLSITVRKISPRI